MWLRNWALLFQENSIVIGRIEIIECCFRMKKEFYARIGSAEFSLGAINVIC